VLSAAQVVWRFSTTSGFRERAADNVTCTIIRPLLPEPLVDEMKDGPIEKVLAKDDVELALEFLMGKRKF
jgi:hypothetical protein